MKLFVLAPLVALALAACSDTAVRYAVPAPAVDATTAQRSAISTIEIREVGLPVYAASEEITTQGEDGALVSQSDILWADDPRRAISLELSRNLSTLTRARVAPEPWPFGGLADGRLDVRFETLLPGADGIYRATGQYFLSAENAGRERSGSFNLAVPYDREAGPTAIAAARGALILDLARLLAREAL